jgi:hypothetical protein
MRRYQLGLFTTFFVLISLQLGAAPLGTEAPEVDLALVLAVDISNSMDPEEQQLQRDGFVEAFRSAAVHKAIQSGALGRIAVTYMQWAGTDTQEVVVPWTVIDGRDSALAFAEQLARSPLRRGPYTSISGAIHLGLRLLAQSGVTAQRQVIDISGDGVNNHGPLVTRARDEAVSRGVTINGLPIMLKKPIDEDVPHLDRYYKDCVIGGTGAFVVPVREPGQFVSAIKTKVILEIAGLITPSLITRAQTEERINCITGEPEVVGWMRP